MSGPARLAGLGRVQAELEAILGAKVDLIPRARVTDSRAQARHPHRQPIPKANGGLALSRGLDEVAELLAHYLGASHRTADDGFIDDRL